MIRIVDYGVGNVQAFVTMFKRLGLPAERTHTAADLADATRLILPGVGAFDHAMQYARHEESLHPTLAYLAFANWPDLGEPRQQAMLAIVDSARKGIKEKLDALAVDAGVTLPTAPAAGD